jgi:hypothetical protein
MCGQSFCVEQLAYMRVSVSRRCDEGIGKRVCMRVRPCKVQRLRMRFSTQTNYYMIASNVYCLVIDASRIILEAAEIKK